MNSNLFFKISRNVKTFISEHKVQCFFAVLITLVAIIFGIYSGFVLCEDLEIEDMTDSLFVSFWDLEIGFLGFLFQRFIFIVLPLILLAFCNHWIFLPLPCYFCFSRGYFFAFNIALLFSNLNIFGMIYVIIVLFPCYFLYCFLAVPCYSVIFKRVCVKKHSKCLMQEKQIINQSVLKFILCFALIIFLVALIESVFLFIFFNKYIFSV